ncbi:TIGR02921 family PEP-CTERM protein [Desulfobacterales bacterium HSG16]|nr:TIGR02921 family PEP-CTERM protein [Desulfobacterales bacterium HSG16]
MKRKIILRIGFHLIFWGWNFLFLLIAYIGILPAIGGSLIELTVAGIVPLEFLFTLTVIVATPALCTGVGIRKRKDPVYLMRLFFGFQLPIFFLFLIRLFVIRERTGGSTLILVTLFISIIAYSIELMPQSWREKKWIPQWFKWLNFFSCTIMVISSLYFGSILLFYAIPGAASFILEFVKFEWLSFLSKIIFSPGFWLLPFIVVFFVFTFVLFIVWTVVLVFLYLSSAYRIISSFFEQYGKQHVLMSSASIFIVWTGFFILNCQQPQAKVFKMLETMPESKEQCAKILKQSDSVRKGLLNAYLHYYRYVSPVEKNNHIEEMYIDVFSMNRKNAVFVQDLYNLLMAPFLYDGSKDDDKKAAKLYADVFDVPIQKAERKAILSALSSTYNEGEVQAGLLDIDKEIVWLAKQEIKIVPKQDMAQVELFEVYENTTFDRQEIFYSFSLPESAVVTGLWLGNSPDKAKSFKFKVSTRGAAQAVYKQEVRRQVDPALLEQVGPRHYRLRAFPVPPKLYSTYDEPQKKQPRLYLWMTFNVMQQNKGWPMPRFAEKRNVFRNETTEFVQNGKSVKHSGRSWLPKYLPADRAFKPMPHEAFLTQGYKVMAKPIYEDGYSLPKSKRFAVVVDTSYSMALQSSKLMRAFKWLKDFLSANNEIDVYICSVSGIDMYPMNDLRGFHSTKSVFFGNLNFGDMIRGFEEVRGKKNYDAMFLLTDEGSYELSKDEDDRPSMKIDDGNTQVWMVHLGGLPKAYDDKTLELIQNSGGGVSENVESAIKRMATIDAAGPSVVNVVDGYLWEKYQENNEENLNDERLPADRKTGQENGNIFDRIAARQMIVAMSRLMDMDDLANLDTVHKTAKKYEIVSPYSSMIVLVNEQQEKALEDAEKKDDRFAREVEDGTETLEKPSNPMETVSGVPEPSTIFLMAAGVFALFIFRRFQNQKFA